jgi:hypothetical protein
MKRSTGLTPLLVAFLLCLGSPVDTRTPAVRAAAPAAQDAADAGPIRQLLQQLEQAARQADPQAFVALLTPSASRSNALSFASEQFAGVATRVVIQERARQALAGGPPGSAYGLTVDALLEYGDKARVATWQLEIRRGDDEAWRIAGQLAVSSVDNLYRLSLTRTKQFAAKNFSLRAEDLELTLINGSVFVIETGQGVTGLVLIGRGEMRFHPPSETEKGQLRIFADADVLESRFDAAYVRLGAFERHAEPSALQPRDIDARDLRRAEDIFRDESVKSYTVDLADLTPDAWSLLPASDDFLAEIRTRRFETLTYARSSAEAEDISLFERSRQKNIASYASREKLGQRGRFYDEDDLAPYDVLDYDINVTSSPARQWIDGVAKLRLRVRAETLGQLTIRLARTLVVRTVISPEYGRLFSLRVSNQDALLVNLPVLLLKDAEMTVTIVYSGRLEPQAPDRETLGPLQSGSGPPEVDEPFVPRPEPAFLYSNRSYWYPQPATSDFATASIQVTVPEGYECVASGTRSPESPRLVAASETQPAVKVYLFNAERPIRYLSFIVSRFTLTSRLAVTFDPPPPSAAGDSKRADDAPYDSIDIEVETSPRQAGRGKDLAERTADIVRFYEGIVGDSPYSSFSLALIENRLPGGHSPGYFAVLNQPLTFGGLSWRNDPAAFADYPEFFLAHEVAHQWWGQAVGWQNYHEQWLSEGFAQYFAALYAERFRGEDVFRGMMRQMRKWAVDQSDQGPVYLGYRVGHIRGDGRAFRAVVYNKGAAVLHMLRLLLGDEAFFRGIRRFYSEQRYAKAGSDDLRIALEKESGRSLDRFFEQWIYGARIPRLTFSYRVERGPGGQEAALHVEQRGTIFDLPVTVILQYADRREARVVIPVTGPVVEVRLPLDGTLRSAEISREDTMADLVRN